MEQGFLYKSRQARRFILKIWTKASRKATESYENLTEDRDPSTSRHIPSTSTLSATKGLTKGLELQNIQPCRGAVLDEDAGEIQYAETTAGANYQFGSLLSGFAVLGLGRDQHQASHTGVPATQVPKENPRATYFYDSLLSLKKEVADTQDGPVLDLTQQTDSPNDNTHTSTSVGGTGLRFDDTDWKLYYGKKGKKKLRKKVLLQVNREERTVKKECYVQLEEAAPEEQATNKKKKKIRRVMSTKAKKRAARVGLVAWKGLKVSWKYLKQGLIFMTDSPGNALNVSTLAKLYSKPNTEGYDRRSYTSYRSR